MKTISYLLIWQQMYKTTTMDTVVWLLDFRNFNESIYECFTKKPTYVTFFKSFLMVLHWFLTNQPKSWVKTHHLLSEVVCMTCLSPEWNKSLSASIDRKTFSSNFWIFMWVMGQNFPSYKIIFYRHGLMIVVPSWIEKNCEPKLLDVRVCSPQSFFLYFTGLIIGFTKTRQESLIWGLCDTLMIIKGILNGFTKIRHEG